jgi:hypothetical protein
VSSFAKRPGVAFWATVVVVVLTFLYPLSIGPVVWLADREMLPERVAEPLAVIYFPLEYAAGTSNAATSVYAWYASFWMREHPVAF